MIQRDAISDTLRVLGIILSFYLATIQTTVQGVGFSLFPGIMIVASFQLQQQYGVDRLDPRVDDSERGSFLEYSIYAFVGATLSSLAASAVYRRFTQASALSILPPVEVVFFGVMIAIAEEEFFRRFLLNYFYKQSNIATTAIVFSSLVFMMFHFVVYGSQPDVLLYVLSSGMVLGYVAWKTKHVTTSMIAHAMVNVVAFSSMKVMP